jgi:hypothetical protein
MKPKVRTLLIMLVVALTLSSAAGGFTAGRVFTVRVGDSADFRPGSWRCNNYRRYIDCFSGDARPYVKIGVHHRCGCTAIKVYNYRVSPRPTRTVENGNAVYTFIAG